MAKAMFFVRQEQSPHIARGLVINCLSRGEQVLLSLAQYLVSEVVTTSLHHFITENDHFPSQWKRAHAHIFAISQGTVTPHYQEF